MKGCAGIFTMGQWLARDLVERCGLPASKVHHVGGGINLDRTLIDESHKTGRRFLFVGRDFRRKNGPLVYEALRSLLSKHPDWELHVAGPAENPYPEDNSANYHYHGDCNHERLAELFNDCDVFVMPSRFEAYGLVFIEALTYGLPCIGRDAYEMPYFIEDGVTGRLLKHQDAAELASLMEETITNKALIDNVRSRRDTYLHDYSWDTVAERIEANIKSNN